MGRSTRRRFLASASTIAGSLAVARRFGLAQSPPIESSDLKLWYTKPASQWVDALPIGNGRLGAMVFGGGAIDQINLKNPKVDHAAGPVPTDPAKETLQLNEDTFWSGLPVDGNNLDAKNYLAAVRKAVLEQKDYHLADQLCQKMQGLFAEAYQPIGSLHVDCTHPGQVTEYRRELDLASATAVTRYNVDDVQFERTAFSSAPDQAIVLRISAGKPGQLNTTVWMDGPLAKSAKTVTGNRLLLTGKAAQHVAGAGHPGSENPVVFSDVPGEGMYYAAMLHVDVEGGRISPSGEKLVIHGATICTIVLTAATGYRGFDQKPDTPQSQVNERVSKQLDAALVHSFPALRQRRMRLRNRQPRDICPQEVTVRGMQYAQPRSAAEEHTTRRASCLALDSGNRSSHFLGFHGIGVLFCRMNDDFERLLHQHAFAVSLRLHDQWKHDVFMYGENLVHAK